MKDEGERSEAIDSLLPKCQSSSRGMGVWSGTEALIRDVLCLPVVCRLVLWLWCFSLSVCSVPLSCCCFVLLLAALTEALSMFLQALS